MISDYVNELESVNNFIKIERDMAVKALIEIHPIINYLLLYVEGCSLSEQDDADKAIKTIEEVIQKIAGTTIKKAMELMNG